jgi:hypothetical protein
MSAAEKQREPRQITEKGQAAITSDLVRSGDQVLPSDPFVINPHLRAATDQIANQIAPDRPVFAHQQAENLEPDRTRSQPDRDTSDQVPISTAEPDHLITSFRSDQVIWFGDGRGGCSDPNLGPPCSASSLDLMNREHVLHELARPDGVPERYLERIRDQATRSMSRLRSRAWPSPVQGSAMKPTNPQSRTALVWHILAEARMQAVADHRAVRPGLRFQPAERMGQ